MRSRFILAGLAVVAAGLAACGGGGGGGSTPLPQTSSSLPSTPTPKTPTPSTPTPSPTPTLAPNYYNFNLPANATFTFKGTLQTSTTYQYPNSAPVAPTNPPSSTSANVTQVATVVTSPNPYNAALIIHTVETDASALKTTTLTSNSYYKTSATAFLELAEASVDDTNDSYTYDYTGTPVQLDAIPEVPGATWMNGAAVAYTEKDADGSTASRTEKAAGTYVENDTQPGPQSGIDTTGVTATITENADGSGEYSSNGTLLGGSFDNLQFATPPAGGGDIVVTANWSANVGPAPTPTPRLYTPAPWYTPSPTLYKETDAVSAATSFPTACAVPAAYGAAGHKVVQTINRLDTILGYTEEETVTAYTSPAYGPVCVVLNDLQTTYYDYNDDYQDASGAHLHFVGLPLSKTTINETLALQSGAVLTSNATRAPASAPAKRNASAASVLGSPQVVFARTAFEHRIALERHQRAQAFTHFMTKGGASK